MIAMLMLYHSYESLPPDFSLADNMLAGAFAGIAVGYYIPSSLSCLRLHQSKIRLGTLRHVSGRSSQSKLFLIRPTRTMHLNLVDPATSRQPFTWRDILKSLKRGRYYY